MFGGAGIVARASHIGIVFEKPGGHQLGKINAGDIFGKLPIEDGRYRAILALKQASNRLPSEPFGGLLLQRADQHYVIRTMQIELASTVSASQRESLARGYAMLQFDDSVLRSFFAGEIR